MTAPRLRQPDAVALSAEYRLLGWALLVGRIGAKRRHRLTMVVAAAVVGALGHLAGESASSLALGVLAMLTGVAKTSST